MTKSVGDNLRMYSGTHHRELRRRSLFDSFMVAGQVIEWAKVLVPTLTVIVGSDTMPMRSRAEVFVMSARLFLVTAAVLFVMSCANTTAPSSALPGDLLQAPRRSEAPLLAGFKKYDLPTTDHPYQVALGSDGNVWFTEFRGGNIGRITPSGVITLFPEPYGQTNGITAGQSGTLWFTYSLIDNPTNIVGEITTSGQITTFSTPSGGCPTAGIARGSDGNIWFTDLCRHTIDRILPDGTVTEFSPPSPNSGPESIAAGPDGNVWYIDDSRSDHGIVGRVTMSGVITEFALPRGVFPGPIVGGSRSLYVGYENSIIRVSTTGNIKIFPSTPVGPVYGVAFFPPRTIWMTGFSGIGSFNVQTHISSPLIPVPNGNNCCPNGIVEGSDGDPWFAETNGKYIGVYR